MITISLCMIVKNEEEVIGRCLECVKDIVDEIIIVDTGSTDSTKEIVSKYTDMVYDFEWIDDFSAARNFSFSKASKDYTMWLDADDIILEADREKLLKIKESLILPLILLWQNTMYPLMKMVTQLSRIIENDCLKEVLIINGLTLFMK